MFKTASIKTHMVVGLTISLILLMVLSSGSFVYFNTILKAVDEVAEESVEELLPIARLQSVITRSAMPANDYFITGSPTEKSNYITLASELSLAFDTALNGKFGESEMDLIQQAQLEWFAAEELSVAILSTTNPKTDPNVAELMEELDRHTQISAAIIDELMTEVIYETQEHAAQAHTILSHLITMLAWVLAGGALIAIYSVHFTLFSILRPLYRLLKGTQHFAEGELDYQVRIDAHNEIGELAGAFNQMADKLYHLTSRDELTGLYNRRVMNQLLEEELQRSQRYNHQMGLLMIDADHFKAINDRYGHAVGDRVLSELSRIVVEVLRDIDVVCRYGGEELVAILPEADSPESLLLAAERIRLAVEGASLNIDGHEEIRYTISIGAALYPQHGEDQASLMKAADAALYSAKSAGRNRSVMSDS